MTTFRWLRCALMLFIMSVLFVPTCWATDVSGTIAADSIWDLAGSPYIVTGNVVVSDGATLTIDPGVEVKFNAGLYLEIQGTLNADGDELNPITITSNEITPAGDDYRGLYFNDGDGLLDNCLIEYAGYYWNYTLYVRYSSNVVIDSCIIRDSGPSGARDIGIYTVNSAQLQVSNTQIYNCGWPVQVSGSLLPVFGTGNDFTGNDHDGVWLRIGTVTGTQTMSDPGVPYALNGNNLNVDVGAQLTIDPDCILKFDAGLELLVHGTLIADATFANPIYMTSYLDDNWGGDTNGDGSATAPSSGHWDGVRFTTSATNSCLMDYVQLRWAGYGSGGGVEIETCNPDITNCEINNCYYGIYITGVCASDISYNTIGISDVTPIAMTFESFPTFSNNEFSASDNGYDAIGIISGTLTASAYLPQRDVIGIPNITYVLLGSVTVPQSYTLEIEAGCVIKIPNYNNQLFIQGNLIADGNPDSIIVFTSVKDDNYGNPGDTNNDGSITSPAAGDWWRIRFDNPAFDTGGILDYCRFTYGGSTHNYNRAEIETYFSSPTITNCYFSDCTRGITLYGNSNPIITNNEFLNTTYEPVEISASSNPTFGGGNTMTNVGYFALGILPETVAVDGTIRVKNFAGYTNITYILNGVWTVASATRVNVEPTVVIKFVTSTSRMEINGSFIVDVPSYTPVVFTSVKDDNYGNPGDTNDDGSSTSPAYRDWDYIGFLDTSDDDSCRIINATILYGDETIRCLNSGPKVDNCYISDCNNAFYIDGNSTTRVWNNDIRNTVGPPIRMSLVSDPDFSGNTFTSCAYNALGVIEGTLSSRAIMKRRSVAGFDPIAYLSTTSTTISSSGSLTIEPGVVWKWLDSYKYLAIYGVLIAEGKTPADSQIVFTSVHDDAYGGDTNNNGNASSPTTGYWQQIYFGDTADDDSCSMKHCRVLYSSGAYISASIRIEDASPTIDSCYVEFNEFAFELWGDAAPTITNNLINDCSYGPIIMDMFCNPTFGGNTFFNVTYSAIAIHGQSFSQNNTVPIRDFGGYTNITYLIWDDLIVNSGTSIYIPQDVVLKFHDNEGIHVDGVLRIVGPTQSSGEMPVLTSYKDDRYGNPLDTNNDGSATNPACNNWSGVYFDDISDDDNCLIDSVLIAYANVAVQYNSAGPIVRNNILEYNNYGFYLGGNSDPTLDNNEVRESCYEPIVMSLTSNPTYQDNYFHDNAYQAIGLIGETMASDAIIPLRTMGGDSNIVYLLRGTTLTVGTNAILTIEPGVVIKLANSIINVRRGLHAIGGATPDSQIVFTSYRDDFYGGDTNQDSNATDPAWGNWDYILFDDQALDPECIMRHCVVRYAAYSSNGAIHCINSSPTITHCRISDNYYGVVASGNSNPILTENDFYNNNYYGVQNTGGSFCIDATNCWWGHSSGPYDNSSATEACFPALYNPTGLGENVSDHVDYSGWQAESGSPLMGDVSLNGAVHAYDATLVLQYVADPVTYPLSSTQQMVADVSGVSGVTAYDASLILQYVAGLIDVFPAEIDHADPTIRPTMPVVASVDGRLTTEDATVPLNEITTIPVTVEFTGDLYSAQFIAQYDPSILSFVGAEIASATSDFLLQTSDNNGTIRVVMAGTYPLSATGEIMHLKFQQAENVHGKVETSLTFTDVMYNEQQPTLSGTTGRIFVIGLPTDYSLGHNYPNPFNPSTNIPYALPSAEHVSVKVYNLQGQLVRTLVDGHQEAGNHVAVWDSRDSNGIPMASGIYFVRMQAADFNKVHKMTLLK